MLKNQYGFEELTNSEVCQIVRENLGMGRSGLEIRLQEGYARLNACGHFDGQVETVDREEVPDGQMDFRDLIDNPQGEGCASDCPCCGRDLDEIGICPLCSYPGLRDGEVCMGIHVPVAFFEQMRFKTKRKGIAYSDTGTPLSAEYCAVILQRWEVQEILLEQGLPIEFIEN